MQRIALSPRTDWRAKVEKIGLIWHSNADQPYWNESAAYVFSSDQIRALERATRELYALFLAAGQHVIDQNLFHRFGIPDWCVPLIIETWEEEAPALNYGRFDLGYDGINPPKLFEFNCDTPTSLVEASVVQWFWKEDVFPDRDQFNSIHEALVARWVAIKPNLDCPIVHFASVEDSAGEDMLTTAYLMDTAREAGLTPERLTMAEIGWNGAAFVDLADREIATLYKLYPWEWLVEEEFGRNIGANDGRTRWIEPIWKMIWSNKAILPILWEMSPGHPNLLRATTEPPRTNTYVKKPILAREGANVSIVRDGALLVETGGGYDGPAIYQDYCALQTFDGASPVIGSWIVDGEPAGMGIREDGLITSNMARFVPHIID